MFAFCNTAAFEFTLKIEISFFSQPFLEKYLKLQDTCGIHNLHAVPGMLGGFIGALVAGVASKEVYGEQG